MNMSIYLKVFFFSIIIGLSGCLESSFQLSEESRLPKWFSVPEGMDRNDLLVQMDLHSTFSGGKAVFKLYKRGNLLNIEKYIVSTDQQPGIRTVQLDSQSSGYPRYKVLTINGITDVVELRKMEPVFYMTDDPAVWKTLGLK